MRAMRRQPSSRARSSASIPNRSPVSPWNCSGARRARAVTRYQQISELDSEHRPQLPGLIQVRELLGEISGILDQAAGLVESADQVTKDMLGGFLSRHPRAGEFTGRFHGRDGVGLEKLAETLVDDQVGRVSESNHKNSKEADRVSESA